MCYISVIRNPFIDRDERNPRGTVRAKCRSGGFIKRSRRSIRFNCIAMGRTAVKLIAQRGVFVWQWCDLYYRNTFERTDGSNDPKP